MNKEKKQELIKLEMSLARLDEEGRVALQSSHRLYIKDQLRDLKKDVIMSIMCDQNKRWFDQNFHQKFKRFLDNIQNCANGCSESKTSFEEQSRKTNIIT